MPFATQMISPTEQVTQLRAAVEDWDNRLNNILNTIELQTDVLLSEDSTKVKYDAILKVEFLFVKARIKVESEHIHIKQLLNCTQTADIAKVWLQKRDAHLAAVSAKLTNIQNDIQILQKVVYTSQYQTFK